jgi:Ni/Fe-hydrogenase subunit HybB-like protein
LAKEALIILAFALGVLILGAYGVTESLVRLGFALGAHECDHGFPWGQVIIGVTLVVPFTLGLATAQKIAESVAARFAGKGETGP